VWLNAVTKYIIDNDWHDKAFIEKHVNNFDAFVKGLEKYTLDYAETHTGLSKEEMIQVATMIKEAESTVVIWTMYITQQRGGSDSSTAIDRKSTRLNS